MAVRGAVLDDGDEEEEEEVAHCCFRRAHTRCLDVAAGAVGDGRVEMVGYVRGGVFGG